MMLSHGELLQHCVVSLNSFNRDTQSVDEHVATYITKNKVCDEEDETFITEVFSGCIRYERVMKAVLDGYYAKAGKSTLKSERNLYEVLCYLSVFRLQELTIPHFSKFVMSQDTNKMYKFFNFFVDEGNLLTWIKDKWCTFYDESFVDSNLISPISGSLPDLQEMVQTLKDKIENKGSTKKPEVQTTEVKEFNLTKPKARSVPCPEPIPKLEKHKPPPKTLYDEPAIAEKLAAEKQKNRQLAEERLLDSCRDQFACANPEKSDKTKLKMDKILMDEENKLNFEKHKARAVPQNLDKDVPVKMTAAQILREGELYKKKEQEELEKLARLESGGRDASDFLAWQKEMQQKDLDQQLADIERRRLEGMLSKEEAILARGNLEDQNKALVQKMKDEAKKLMDEMMEQKSIEAEEMRRLVEETIEGHQNVKEAQKKLQEYKQKFVQQVNDEQKGLMQRALEEAEEEMRRKMELIHQIRAMEAVPVIRHQFVDLTETAGAGLLNEMSIVELRERLGLMKSVEEEEEQRKRDDIIAEKQAKDQSLIDTLEKISKHREEQSKSAAAKLEEKKQAHAKAAAAPKDEKLMELQRKLEEKKLARKKEQEAAKANKNKQGSKRTESLVKQKNALEENRWKQLESSKERMAKLTSQGIDRKSLKT